MRRQGNALPRQTTKRWLSAFALLAFLLQGLAVQTHVHIPSQPQAQKTASLPVPGPLKTQDPIDQCRLCQELVHAGVFVAPSEAAVALSLNFVAASHVLLPSLSVASATAFAWQSRAPPKA